MIFIFHGSNFTKSRGLLTSQIAKSPSPPISLEAKSLDQNQLNNLLSGSSLFALEEPLVINNFFSLPPPTIQKFAPLFNQSTRNIYLWQDKGLTLTQLKLFPKAQIFKADTSRQVWQLLNAIRPKNYVGFARLFEAVIKEEPPELLFYLLRQHLRKNLTPTSLPTYLSLINADYLTKSGQSQVEPVNQVRAIFAGLLL
ncbi:MAG: hypothetical protein WCV93_02930 [Candidatus Shapirobacteria bacterium]|jgi:hypothetical protein